MRILAISYLFPNCQEPNYGIFVFNRLKAISKYCDIQIINPIPWFPFSTIFARYKQYRQVPKKEIIAGLEVYHPRFLSLPWIFKFIEPIILFFVLFPLLRRINRTYHFDIVDVHWLYPDLPAADMLARIFRKKMIVTLRGREALFAAGMWKFKHIIVPVLNRADYIISLSHELRKLCQNNGVTHNRFAIIRNGADTEKFGFSGMQQARRQLGMNGKEKIILSVGSLIYGKGFDRIIKCLNKLSTEYSGISLYILGNSGKAGNYAKKLEDISIEYGVKDRVVFVGSVPNQDLVNWYNAADIFCLASRGEGSPNVLSEALTSGCPAVSTDVGAVADILTKKEMGEIVANDDDAVCGGLRIALKNAYDRQGVAAYMEKFSWDWCARQVVEVYGTVLGKKK